MKKAKGHQKKILVAAAAHPRGEVTGLRSQQTYRAMSREGWVGLADPKDILSPLVITDAGRAAI